MSLRQVDKSGYSRFVDSAKRCTANRVYPMSIAEGYQKGDIYIDEKKGAVMFWHYCGFVYFSGSPSADLLEEVYQEFLKKKQERRFIIITDDEETKDFFSRKDSSMYMMFKIVWLIVQLKPHRNSVSNVYPGIILNVSMEG